MVINTEEYTCLEQGSITVLGEFVWGSNYTFLTQVDYHQLTCKGVYKPSKGEQPLWDFPVASLAKREAATFLISQAIGWGFVPPTCFRKNAPLGPGSLQLFVDHDPEYHFFNFSESDRLLMRPVVLFDLIINNADRKGSHILKDSEGKFWLIDHGLSFHVENKLRTVIWDFIGEPISKELLDDINHFNDYLSSAENEQSNFYINLNSLISNAEISAMRKRADVLLATGKFPAPEPNRRPFPWPQI